LPQLLALSNVGIHAPDFTPIGKTKIGIAGGFKMARYTVRQYTEDGFKSPDEHCWAVWDKETDAPAEAHGFKYINLRQEKAREEAETLNDAE
jgi:hypothetical protein